MWQFFFLFDFIYDSEHYQTFGFWLEFIFKFRGFDLCGNDINITNVFVVQKCDETVLLGYTRSYHMRFALKKTTDKRGEVPLQEARFQNCTKSVSLKKNQYLEFQKAILTESYERGEC